MKDYDLVTLGGRAAGFAAWTRRNCSAARVSIPFPWNLHEMHNSVRYN